jgi:hypothetical protein
MCIEDNLNRIKEKIADEAQKCNRRPEDIQLVAVTKKQTVQTIWTAIQAGARTFGENYIQEARDKIETIRNRVQEQNIQEPSWHFIGHLQRNKAKYAVRYFDWIHSVDSLALMEELDRCAQKLDKRQKILIQVSTGEIQKAGVSQEQLISLIQRGMHLKHISICGLMAMPPYAQDPEESRPYFQNLSQLLNQIQSLCSGHSEHPLNQLSMGMTGDFGVAIQEGATFVRVGTAIFGKRESFFQK